LIVMLIFNQPIRPQWHWILPSATTTIAATCTFASAWGMHKLSRCMILPAHIRPSSPRDGLQHDKAIKISLALHNTVDDVHDVHHDSLHAYIFDTRDNEKKYFQDLSDEDKQNRPFIIMYQGNNVNFCNLNIENQHGLLQNLRNACTYNNACLQPLVVCFTYPNVGYSDGSFLTFSGLAHYCMSVFNCMRKKGVPAEHIIHYGHSIGGVVATKVVADLHRKGIRTHLRCDRSIMRLDGALPDLLINRNDHP